MEETALKIDSSRDKTNKKCFDIVRIRNRHHIKRRKFKSWIRKKIYILTWIGTYNTYYAFNDLIAGITLGLTIIPESIACALLAGLPSYYGLCSAFIGPLIYLFFGTVNKVIIGPTSLVALVTLQFTMGKPIELAFIMTLLAGIVELIMGLCRLGFLFDFISITVIKAFTSATAILVVESQIKVILGIKYIVPGFLNSILTLLENIEDSKPGDVIVGLSSISFLLILNILQYIPIKRTNNFWKFLKAFLNYTSLSRNALLVFITATITYIWTYSIDEKVPYNLGENLSVGLPTFSFPKFYFESNNKTYNVIGICKELGTGIFVVPLVSVLTNISIAKALTPKGLVDASQELMVLGLCNIIGSGVQSMPTCGAFSRAAISSASGIKTSLAGLYSSILVILALSFLTPYFYYIPNSALAAILMCAIVTLIDFKLPLKLWREDKRDFCTWLLCFLTCILLGVEIGLFLGIILTVAHLLFMWARPSTSVKTEEKDEMQFIKVIPTNGIYFPGIDYLRKRILKACIMANFQVPVVIDCQKIVGLDYTAAQGILKLAKELDGNDQSQILILYQLNYDLQRLIDKRNNIFLCESDEKLYEILTQESLKNGFINLKDYVRASIDLGYKVES